jgi:hypothetical protein
VAQVIFGLVFLALGATGLFSVNRRAFYRRNVAGIEEFDGYTKMLVTKLFEKTVRVISLFFVLGGIAMLALNFMRH